MATFKKIIIGFLVCHIILLSLLYLNLYFIGVFGDWNNTFVFATIIFSYIPIMEIIGYFIFSFVIWRFNLGVVFKIVLVSLLTALVSSIIVYLQSHEIYMATITAISTLIMSFVLTFIERKKAH
ncbi:hypothetical protein [Bacillus sonorensis]|uniref:hypothetical protein n=1 Tax=Bacillus sonorensis TaxID=119858 RepID=UPI00098A8F38|nr:hypothetical protein [Bacillus sonorensis]